MRLSWVIPSEAVTKTRQTYFGILETALVRYITLRAVYMHPNYDAQIRDLFRTRPTYLLREYTASTYRIFRAGSQRSVARVCLIKHSRRDRDESGAKRSTRADFSLLDKFPRFPPISILRILDRSSLGAILRCAARIHGLSAILELKFMDFHWDSFRPC